jgi:hypothetical protein
MSEQSEALTNLPAVSTESDSAIFENAFSFSGQTQSKQKYAVVLVRDRGDTVLRRNSNLFDMALVVDTDYMAITSPDEDHFNTVESSTSLHDRVNEQLLRLYGGNTGLVNFYDFISKPHELEPELPAFPKSRAVSVTLRKSKPFEFRPELFDFD